MRYVVLLGVVACTEAEGNPSGRDVDGDGIPDEPCGPWLDHCFFPDPLEAYCHTEQDCVTQSGSGPIEQWVCDASCYCIPRLLPEERGDWCLSDYDCGAQESCDTDFDECRCRAP